MSENQQLAVADDSAYDTMALMPKNMAQAQEFAKQLASSTLIPKHLQNKPGDCLMVTMQAYRWRMDPFVVANCTSFVHGRMMYEGKLVYAALKSMNAIEGRLEFELDGDGQDAKITVTGTPRGGKPQSISGTVKGWRTFSKDKETGRQIPNNWDKDPLSQLVYRGTRQWARLFSPEALLGVYAPEDSFDDPETPIEVALAQAVPTKATPATPIEEGEVVPPKPKRTPVKAAPAAPQATSAPAPASAAPEELFDDPAQAQAAPAPATPAAPAAPAAEEAPDLTDMGEPITETMGRVIEAARTNSKTSKETLAAKFPGGIGKGNINIALAWLRSRDTQRTVV